jgi:hypothetical protein
VFKVVFIFLHGLFLVNSIIMKGILDFFLIKKLLACLHHVSTCKRHPHLLSSAYNASAKNMSTSWWLNLLFLPCRWKCYLVLFHPVQLMMEADGWLMLVIVSFLSRSYRKRGTPSPFLFLVF